MTSRLKIAARSLLLRDALVLVLVVVYAFCFVAIKAGLAYAPPLLFGGFRVTLAGAVLFALAAALRRPLAPARQDWLPLAALALSSTTIGFGAMFLATGQTGAGVASVLGNTQPLVVAVLAATFLGERLTRSTAAALGLGLAGVGLVSLGALRGPGAFGASGTLLALAVSGAAGVSSVVVKRLGSGHDPLLIAAWPLVLGGLPLLLVGALAEGSAAVTWDRSFIGLLRFLALPGTALAVPAWYWLVQREALGPLSIFLFLVPVFGLALAVVLDGERVSLAEGTGVVLTIAAAAIAGRARHGGTGPSTLTGSPQPAISHATAGLQPRLEG